MHYVVLIMTVKVCFRINCAILTSPSHSKNVGIDLCNTTGIFLSCNKIHLAQRTIINLTIMQHHQVAEFTKCAGKTIQMTINAQMKTVRE